MTCIPNGSFARGFLTKSVPVQQRFTIKSAEYKLHHEIPPRHCSSSHLSSLSLLNPLIAVLPMRLQKANACQVVIQDLVRDCGKPRIIWDQLFWEGRPHKLWVQTDCMYAGADQVLVLKRKAEVRTMGFIILGVCHFKWPLNAGALMKIFARRGPRLKIAN